MVIGDSCFWELRRGMDGEMVICKIYICSRD